jgi:predicted membrane-bound mannosyltransferase
MLPEASWSFLAGIALLFVIVEAFATRAMRHALPWFGFERGPGSLTCATIKARHGHWRAGSAGAARMTQS